MVPERRSDLSDYHESIDRISHESQPVSPIHEEWRPSISDTHVIGGNAIVQLHQQPNAGALPRRKPLPITSTVHEYTPVTTSRNVAHCSEATVENSQIYWMCPLAITATFLLGFAFALGHHLYYNSLVGQPSSSQEWALRIGTGLAFLVKACLATAAGLAYAQHCWSLLRKRATTVNGINNMLDALSDITAFLSLNMLVDCFSAAVIALVIWCIPLIAITPPASLTVQADNTVITSNQAVSMVDWARVPTVIDGSSTPVTAGEDTYRISVATAYGSMILPMTAKQPNYNYSLNFHAPSLRCNDVDSADQSAFDRLLGQYWHNTTGNQDCYNATWAIKTIRYSDDPDYQEYRNYQLFIQTDVRNITCQMWNSTYNVDFSYRDTVQTTTISNVSYDTKVTYRGRILDDRGVPEGAGFHAWFDTLQNLLVGTIHYAGYSEVTTITSQILRTSLSTCPELSKIKKHLDLLIAPINASNPCPGGNLSRALEMLSQNITMSFFSYTPSLLRDNETAIVPVTTTTTDNVFHYNARSLLLSYGLGLLVTMCIMLVGFYAIWSNGVCHSTSFSSILCSTRNPELDELAQGHHLAAQPMTDDLHKVKLQFGMLHSGDPSKAHAAFGFPGTVARIKRDGASV